MQGNRIVDCRSVNTYIIKEEISMVYQIVRCFRKMYLYSCDNGTVRCPSRVAIRVRRTNDISSPLPTVRTFVRAGADSYQICSSGPGDGWTYRRTMRLR